MRVGSRTLAQLYAALDAAQSRDGFAQRLTYFDCTDSIEKGEGVVTNARPGEPCDLSMTGHLRLLWLYVTQGRPDVHSGYFAPGFVGQLIYRFACIAMAIASKPTANSMRSAPSARRISQGAARLTLGF